MKKGKFIIATAGILDLLFALGLFAVIAMYFAGVNLVGGLFVSILSVFSMIVPITIDLLQILSYVVIGLLGVIGILSIIFGSVSIARVRKESKSYYHKGGRLIAYAVLETIALALFVFALIRYYSLISVIVVSLLGLIVVLRYIGIFMFFSGKKKYVAETPVA